MIELLLSNLKSSMILNSLFQPLLLLYSFSSSFPLNNKERNKEWILAV